MGCCTLDYRITTIAWDKYHYLFWDTQVNVSNHTGTLLFVVPPPLCLCYIVIVLKYVSIYEWNDWNKYWLNWIEFIPSRRLFKDFLPLVLPRIWYFSHHMNSRQMRDFTSSATYWHSKAWTHMWHYIDAYKVKLLLCTRPLVSPSIQIRFVFKNISRISQISKLIPDMCVLIWMHFAWGLQI